MPPITLDDSYSSNTTSSSSSSGSVAILGNRTVKQEDGSDKAKYNPQKDTSEQPAFTAPLTQRTIQGDSIGSQTQTQTNDVADLNLVFENANGTIKTAIDITYQGIAASIPKETIAIDEQQLTPGLKTKITQFHEKKASLDAIKSQLLESYQQLMSGSITPEKKQQLDTDISSLTQQKKDLEAEINALGQQIITSAKTIGASSNPTAPANPEPNTDREATNQVIQLGQEASSVSSELYREGAMSTFGVAQTFIPGILAQISNVAVQVTMNALSAILAGVMVGVSGVVAFLKFKKSAEHQKVESAMSELKNKLKQDLDTIEDDKKIDQQNTMAAIKSIMRNQMAGSLKAEAGGYGMTVIGGAGLIIGKVAAAAVASSTAAGLTGALAAAGVISTIALPVGGIILGTATAILLGVLIYKAVKERNKMLETMKWQIINQENQLHSKKQELQKSIKDLQQEWPNIQDVTEKATKIAAIQTQAAAIQSLITKNAAIPPFKDLAESAKQIKNLANQLKTTSNVSDLKDIQTELQKAKPSKEYLAESKRLILKTNDSFAQKTQEIQALIDELPKIQDTSQKKAKIDAIKTKVAALEQSWNGAEGKMLQELAQQLSKQAIFNDTAQSIQAIKTSVASLNTTDQAKLDAIKNGLQTLNTTWAQNREAFAANEVQELVPSTVQKMSEKTDRKLARSSPEKSFQLICEKLRNELEPLNTDASALAVEPAAAAGTRAALTLGPVGNCLKQCGLNDDDMRKLVQAVKDRDESTMNSMLSTKLNLNNNLL